MTATQEMSMETELLKEVENYLPDMRGFLRVLAVDGSSQHGETVKELFRMTHSIRGAASMVQLNDLSKTAGLMEDVLETLLEKKRDWNEQLIDVMKQTIESIGLYCTSMYEGTADGTKLYESTLQLFEPINALPLVATAADNEDTIGEDALLALFGDESDEDSTDDLFQELFDEKDMDDAGDGLVVAPAADFVAGDLDFDAFLETADDDSQKESLDRFLGVAESKSQGLTSEVTAEGKTPAPLSTGIDPDLQESFNEEAEEHLDNINRQLNEFSSIDTIIKIVGEYRERLHSIRRSVHTLKGAAAVIGIETVAEWGHTFEDFLDSLHDESPVLSQESIAAMQDGTTIIEKLVADPTADVSAEIVVLQAVFLAVLAKSSSARTNIGEERIATDLGVEIESQVRIEHVADVSEKNTSAIAPELMESFDEEAGEHLDNISRQLNELSASVNKATVVEAEHRERLHSLLRSVHTLKGAAAVIGLKSVAGWGHEFEDFLDNLHDNSDIISPESIAAMQDGTDILEKIVTNPAADVSADIKALQAVFPSVMAASLKSSESIEEEDVVQNGLEEESIEPCTSQNPSYTGMQTVEEHLEKNKQELSQESQKSAARKGTAPLRITGSKNKQKQLRKSTLRVGSDKIAELMGLSGDMTINLSSFEDSTSFMQSNLDEFELTLKRLKGIASSLEAGYELASIPHVSTTSDGGQDEFDPLEMDRYSELHILIRSLNEAIVDLDSIKSQASTVQGSWKQAIDRQRMVVSEVQASVNSIQMTPFSTLGNRLYKTVRESARVTGKKIRLLIKGGSIEMDTSVWDILIDALMHMLRNCVDHGIESVDVRKQLDKPGQATITIDCSRQGSRFVLRLSDDGSGLDYEAIRSRGIALYPESGVEKMDNNALAALIFKQGFSVREKVTTMSGRGVGMDVVRDAIEQLNGFIEVQSTPGEGTEFVLSMPIIVAQLPALMVLFGNQQFAVPMRDVTTVLRLSAEEMSKEHFKFGNEQLPLLWPVDLLRLKPSTRVTGTENRSQNNPIAFVVDTGNRRGVLMADAVLGQKNIIFKNLGSHLQDIPYVAGATILGDGSLVPILQTEDMFRRSEKFIRAEDTARIVSKNGEKKLEILIVDDSISVRKVLSNFVQSHDWYATVASDGVDGMKKIREQKPDLVLLDIEMPRMNGFEVLQAMQTQTAYRDVPVLMLTSRSAVKYREKATELGASGFVTKPYKDDELFSLICGLTGQETAERDQQ